MERILWLAVWVMMTAWVEVVHGQDCRTWTGEVGQCISIRFCPDLKRLLRQIQSHTAPPGAMQILRASVCDLTNNIPRICCKKQQSLQGGGGSGEALLPKDCGRILAVDDLIVGGVDASPTAWPWIALIRGSRGRSRWICGGILISDRYVLTAAHCLPPYSGFSLDFVRLGEYDISRDPDCERRLCAPTPQDIAVAEMIPHESFSKVRGCPICHDIALLRLARPARLDLVHVVPVCLPKNLEQDLGISNNDFSSQFGWVAGWGTIDNKRTRQPSVLQEALVPIGKTYCNTSIYPDPNMIICAGGEGADTCGGDSGGPLIMGKGGRFYAVGVVSNGPKICGARQTQGLYTSLNYYLPWILDHLRP